MRFLLIVLAAFAFAAIWEFVFDKKKPGPGE